MSVNIFIPSTRKNSSGETTKEDVELVIWSNPKTGQEYKLLNLENESLAPRSGLIEIKPIKVTKRHENNVGFNLLNDKVRSCFIGIPITWDHESGRAIWQKINLSNFGLYDLSIPEQRREWIMVKNSPYFTDVLGGVEQNPNFDGGMKAQYRAVDKEREANLFMRNRKDKRKAEDHAENLLDFPEELKEMALMCGIETRSRSTQRIWADLVIYAEKNSTAYLKIANSDTKAELAVYKRGLATGVINESLVEGTSFNGLTLGHTEQEVLAYLKDKPSVCASIDALSRKKDGESKVIDEKGKAPGVESAAEALLKRENEMLKKKLSEITDKKLEDLSEDILNAEDPEFAELLKEAKRLDVKGAHKIVDKEKLRQRVEEKKKLKAS